MNERINELFGRALDQAVPETWTTLNPAQLSKLKDKFAELIVRECIELCKKQEYDYWRSSEEQDFTPIDCADAIKQHFGVEE